MTIMRELLILIMMVLTMPLSLMSCSDDDDEMNLAEQIQLDGRHAVRRFLNDSIVVSSKVTINGVDKTLLSTGCPTLLFLSWESDSMWFELPEMRIGNMPFSVSFKAKCSVEKLNSWEEDEHAGGQGCWFKFVSNNGYVSTGNDPYPNGSSIKGFFNLTSHEIEFVIDYNVMNARTVCERQVLDLSRAKNFKAEMEQYMKDLQAEKKENGMYDTPEYDIPIPDFVVPNGYLGVDTLLRDSTAKDIEDSPIFIPTLSLKGIKGILNGDIVVYATVYVKDEQQNQKPYPVKLNFSWDEDDNMVLTTTKLVVLDLPYTVSFSCVCGIHSLNNDEMSRYGLLYSKFVGEKGYTSLSLKPGSVPSGSYKSGKEGTVSCYFNPYSNQIELYVNFGTMGLSIVCENQRIDFSKTDGYDEELQRYIEDYLAE